MDYVWITPGRRGTDSGLNPTTEMFDALGKCYENPACARAGHRVKLSGHVLNMRFVENWWLITEFGKAYGLQTPYEDRDWAFIAYEAAYAVPGGYGLVITHEMGHFADIFRVQGYQRMDEEAREMTTRSYWNRWYCSYTLEC